MKTPMPASPFQYDSMVVPSAMDEAATLGTPPMLESVAAEIPGALVAPGPAAAACFSPPRTAAGDNSTWRQEESRMRTCTQAAPKPALGSKPMPSPDLGSAHERVELPCHVEAFQSSCGGGESGPTGRHWPSPSYAQSAEPMGGCTEQTEAGVAPGPHEAFTAGGPQRALPAVAETETHETGRALGFVLDEAAFMEAIEANPLFLETFPLNARVK